MTELISSFEAALKRFENAVDSITTTFRKLNENQNTAIHRAAARRYEERNPRSRIGNTDILSSWDAGMRKLEMRDKLKEFNFATRMSGFGRYVDKESEVVDSIDNKNELLDAGNRNRARMRSERNYRFWYDNADEFDQKMHDLTMRYHGDKKSADQTYRKMLQREFPIFFKNSKMSTKDMHKMATGMRNMRGIPLVGSAIGIMSNPISGSVSALLGALSFLGSLKNEKIESVKSSTELSNLKYTAGTPSKRFMSAIGLAGLNEVQGLQMWSKLQDLYFGFGEDILMSLATTKGMNEHERRAIAYGYGLDETSIVIADQMYGGGTNNKENRDENRRITAIEAVQKYGYENGSPWQVKVAKFGLDWFGWMGLKSGMAHDLEANKWSFTDAEAKWMSEKMGYDVLGETNDAAASLDNYQRNGGDYSVGAYGSSGDKTTTKIYQLNGDIITDADNIKKLAADAEGKTEIIDRYEESVSADTKRSR